MVPPHLHLKKKGGLQGKIQSELCLTKEQAKQIYDKIESGELCNVKLIGKCNNRMI